MKNEKILRALGEISDDLVADAAIAANDNGRRKAGGRRVICLASAVVMAVCLLGTSVFAASVIYGRIQGRVDNVVEAAVDSSFDADGSASGGMEMVYEISLDIELDSDAPRTIESCFLPQIPEVYPQSFGYAYAGLDYDRLGVITYAWDVPDGEKMGIMFYQYSADYYANEGMTAVISGGEQAPTVSPAAVGGMEGIQILAPEEFGGRQYFYWSDGKYVFMLRCPSAFTAEQMDRLVSGVERVENIRPYLVSMTEEEIERTLS